MNNTETIEPIRLTPPPAGTALPAWLKTASRGFVTHVLPPLLVIGLLVVNLIQPGSGMHVDAASLDTTAIAAYTEPGKMKGTVDFLLGVIPSSVVDAFAKGDILQVLLFSVLFGFALHKFGGRGTMVFDFIEKFSHVLFGIVGYILRHHPAWTRLISLRTRCS